MPAKNRVAEDAPLYAGRARGAERTNRSAAELRGRRRTKDEALAHVIERRRNLLLRLADH